VPAIIRKLQKRQIEFEHLDSGEAGVISIHSYTDAKGKEYRVGPGMVSFDEYIINTDRLIGGTPTASRGGIKIQIEGLNENIMLSEHNYEIPAVLDLIMIAQNLNRHPILKSCMNNFL
jgi:hypothetical protein